MTARIFVLEDHAAMRESLVALMEELPDTEVCGAAATAEEALPKLAETDADLVLVDIQLPGMSGLEFVREAQQRWPGLLCLVLTGHDETAYMLNAFSQGAHGFVRKGNTERLKDAITSMLGRPPVAVAAKSSRP